MYSVECVRVWTLEDDSSKGKEEDGLSHCVFFDKLLYRKGYEQDQIAPSSTTTAARMKTG